MAVKQTGPTTGRGEAGDVSCWQAIDTRVTATPLHKIQAPSRGVTCYADVMRNTVIAEIGGAP